MAARVLCTKTYARTRLFSAISDSECWFQRKAISVHRVSVPVPADVFAKQNWSIPSIKKIARRGSVPFYKLLQVENIVGCFSLMVGATRLVDRVIRLEPVCGQAHDSGWDLRKDTQWIFSPLGHNNRHGKNRCSIAIVTRRKIRSGFELIDFGIDSFFCTTCSEQRVLCMNQKISVHRTD